MILRNLLPFKTQLNLHSQISTYSVYACVPLPPAPQIYGFCGALFGTVSIITMALIAFDRYRAIVTPFAGVLFLYI